MKIILFEDTPQYEDTLLAALRRELADKGQVVLFKAVRTGDAMYEDRLEGDLSELAYKDSHLIVADRDLSKLARYGGLSEATVRRIADRLGIPECSYARGDKEGDFLHKAEWRESRIAVSIGDGDQRFARQVIAVAEGFQCILDKLPAVVKIPGKHSAGKLLANVLGKPEYSEKISLYASGDQNRLANVLGVGTTDVQGLRRLCCFLGYWLWDSVLRYPGVCVNAVAASSYLNIKEEMFQDPSIHGAFEAARYSGPFAEVRGPLWWRGMLDDMVAESGFNDGRELVSAKLETNIQPSECCEDPQKTAGYFCMVTLRPVSLENSKPGLPWFPRGADLARISTRKYEEVVPWL